MSVPVLLVTGFLGAGKTTLINGMLQAGHGLRIAAIVNDFGSINIDAALLESASDSVIGLKNGCICCSLQGDLLRTLKQVLGSGSAPDLVVIEASGVADPGGIMQALMDPMIWQQASLEAVVCVVDALDAKLRKEDALWRAQLSQSDIVVLAKAEGLEPDARTALTAQLGAMGKRHIYDANEPLPLRTLLAQPRNQRAAPTAPIRDDRFVHLEWELDGPVSLPAFQDTMTALAPSLLRAKGFLQLAGREGAFTFQLVGQRAAMAPRPGQAGSGCQLVLIGERATFDPEAARARLNAMVETGGA
ncbi:CobW family GTP-binding protein [Albibacillus kandeliae]|uniref:CobW family GTP-binding protein n=1 Tax=Albibacillus kandeliae TaxID=2174228 RepID=UPI000D69E272|nr:GTP-binding protein [Albibacillus kandeliae]